MKEGLVFQVAGSSADFDQDDVFVFNHPKDLGFDFINDVGEHFGVAAGVFKMAFGINDGLEDFAGGNIVMTGEVLV